MRESMISSIRSMTRVTGPIFYMCISLSAFMTSRQITIARSTMTYSCVPFYALSSNAFVAILYSILVRDAVLLAPNLVGMVLGIICVFTFHFYAVEPVNYRVQLLSFYVILAGLFFFCLSETKILGILMDITCVVMLSSPLANIYEVCTHLRGEAGERQVEGAKLGMTHVIGLGTACGIHILEKV